MPDPVRAPEERLDVPDEAAMRALGQRLAAELPPRALVTLSGDLGAGKSVLARALLHALGHVGPVPSPTYAIVESYDLPESHGLPRRRVAHLDLYRLADPDELHAIGFDDVLVEHELLLIEWPERGGALLPTPCLAIDIEHAGEETRRVVLRRRYRHDDSLDKADASSML